MLDRPDAGRDTGRVPAIAGVSWKERTVTRTNLQVALVLLGLLPLAACSEQPGTPAGQQGAVLPRGPAEQRVDQPPGEDPVQLPADPMPAASSRILAGKVVAIADGDTLTVLVGTNQHTIRLHGIDCPESGQPFGTRAKEFTSSAAFGKTVSVETVDVDQYGRTVGRVLLPDGSDLGQQLVKAGLAWWYVYYTPNDTTLAGLEKAARAARVGLWGDAGPVPPWEWRRGTRIATASPATPRPPPGVAGTGGYWLNTATGTRHNSGCQHYRNTKAGRECGPADGKACETCGG